MKEFKLIYRLRKYLFFISIAGSLYAEQTIRIGQPTPYKSPQNKDIELSLVQNLKSNLEKENYKVNISEKSNLKGVKEAKDNNDYLFLDVYYSKTTKLKEFYVLIYDPLDQSLIDAIYYSSRFKVPEEIDLPQDEISDDDPKMIQNLMKNVIFSIQSNKGKLESRENIEINFLRTQLSKHVEFKLRKVEDGKKTEEILKLLNPVQETASKRDEKLNDAPATMTIITKADIEKYGYKNLPEALARVPEVYVHYNGHNYSADFRGFFANNVERRVLYMLDGQRLNDRFHFGDFYPDVINDLNNVERIEIIRGPGAAIYGNNAVLGVVNIITKKPVEKNPTTLLTEFSNLRKSSYISKTQVIHNIKYNDYSSFMIDVNWYNGSILYDTKTNWANANGSPGITRVNFSTDAYFGVDKSLTNKTFTTGDPLPNIHSRYTYKDFTIIGFLYTRKATWVWPKDGFSFGNSDNDRVWGTGSIKIEYKPTENFLSKMDFVSSLSYNINTNRETATYEYDKTILPNGKLRDYNSDIFFIKDLSGQIVSYNKTIPRSALSNEAIIANGGGMKIQYHGIDRVTSFFAQISPIKNNFLNFTTGLNLDYANYANYQRYTYKNNTPIGFHPRGSIIDSGMVAGTWTDFLFNPRGNFQLNIGARFDAQYIKQVRRHGGGETFYYKDVNDDNRNFNRNEYLPRQAEKLYSQNIAPRISFNYYISQIQNIRLIFTEAFRAVTPQEIIRLSDPQATAKPETTKSYEVIYNLLLFRNLSITSNIFTLKGSEIYAWTPVNLGFSRGTGWSNRGFTFGLQYIGKSWETWFSVTSYDLKRPVDAYHQYIKQDLRSFIPNTYRPLDSPTELFKWGGSYSLINGIHLAGEVLYNSRIIQLYPNDNDFNNKSTMLLTHKVPASIISNLTISKAWVNGVTALFQVSNLFNNMQWFGMNYDIQSSFGSYEKPHQLPGFGRMFAFQIKYNF